MDKNLVKAFLLSAAVLLGWQFLAPYVLPPEPPAPQEQQAADPAATPPQADQQPVAPPAPDRAASPAPDQAASAAPAVEALAPEPPRTITVETSRWIARFENRGGVPVSWTLTRGPDDKPIHAADGSDLELISSLANSALGPPLRLEVPGDAEATNRLNSALYRVETRSGAALEAAGPGAAGPGAAGPGAAPPDTVAIADGERVELAFTASDAATNQIVTKRYTFTGGTYDFQMTVDSSAGARPFGVVVGPRIGDQSIKKEGSYSYTPPHAVVALETGKVENLYGGDAEAQPVAVEGFPRWVGITDNYFAMAAAGANAPRAQAMLANTKLKFAEQDEKLHDFVSVTMPVEAGRPLAVFVGPKDPRVLDEASQHAAEVVGAPVDFSNIVNYGYFSFIVRPIVPIIDQALAWTNRITHNYGWSIVIVTTLFNLLFFPLRYKSSKAMKRAAKLQPRMKDLQAKMKKYKPTDPQFKELQQEQLALMKEGNPLGGCLPMLVQFPFFWAFFIYFTTTFVVRRQPWIGWVQDLTAPDPYYILPVLMCAAQIGSMLVMPMPNADDPVAKMQRRMMTWVMPIAFTYFFLVAAPSGLVLYWMTLNLVGIGVQFAINKMLPPDEATPAEPAGKGGSKPAKKGRSPELVGTTGK